MKKAIPILVSLLVIIGVLSCNLDGSGIFLTISKSTEIADSKLATEPVRDILYKDTNTMYILYGTTVKKADISAANPTWNDVDFLRTVSEAVFIPGSPPPHKLVYSSIQTDDNYKSVYVGSLSAPNSSTLVTGLDNVQVIDLIADGTTVYAITYNVTADIVSVSLINISASSSSIINTFSSTVAPTAVHFVSTGATPADKHFIFVYPDSTQSYKNSFRTLPDLSTATDMVDPVFDRSDDAAKNSPIIGAYAYGTTIYLITNEGILITSDDNLANFAAVNKADSSEFMSLVLNPTGSTAADFSVPMTIVTKGDTTKLLIMGGISGIYYYDITGLSTDIPIKFSSEDAFYSNVSSTHILDFYNVPIDADFSLYTATSDKWIWETVDENTASSQLL